MQHTILICAHTETVFDKEENQMCVFCSAWFAVKFEAAAEKKTQILLEYPFNGTKASSHKLQIQVYVPDWIFYPLLARYTK